MAHKREQAELMTPTSGAALILFGSRAGLRPREAADWDFGVHFRQSDRDRELRGRQITVNSVADHV